jgi:hypothetical protein
MPRCAHWLPQISWQTTVVHHPTEGTVVARRFRPRLMLSGLLLPTEAERQAGNGEGREKDRQKPLAGASKGDYFAVGGIEGLSSARISAISDLQGVTSRFDWYLDRVVHFNRPDRLTVD